MDLYHGAVDLFVRPARVKYTVAELGDVEFERGGRKYRRRDFQVPPRTSSLVATACFLAAERSAPSARWLRLESPARRSVASRAVVVESVILRVLRYDI